MDAERIMDEERIIVKGEYPDCIIEMIKQTADLLLKSEMDLIKKSVYINDVLFLIQVITEERLNGRNKVP